MKNIISYNKSGKEAQEGQKIFAKHSNNEDRDIYFILTQNNNPYDPNGASGNRENVLNLTLKQTSKEAFEWYLKYLQTKNLIYFTRTNRSFLNA